MKRILVSIVSIVSIGITLIFTGCGDKSAPKQAPLDLAAGKTLAEADCKGCHGLDGKGTAPGIPHLAAQSQAYLLASLKAYKEGKRTHAALRDMASHLSEAQQRNVVGFYASLPPVSTGTEGATAVPSPYEAGKAAAAKNCANCHGADGNSTVPGTPSLAGQQPLYFVHAVQSYLDGSRQIATMEAMLRGLSKVDVENMAVYYASQVPATRPAPAFGDPKAGEPLTASCGGCHGAKGISHDAATPTLAGQDAQYLVTSIKAYRDGKSRKHGDMRQLLADSTDQAIENIAAFYATQKSKAAEDKPLSVQELAAKCDRCHGAGVNNPTMAMPKISGQDKDYLVMALRAYRNGKRESSMMHNMSLPYSDTVINSIADWYAKQPAR